MPKLKFLVVEDDLFYQTYVNDLLVETGADIINATDGETALKLAESEQPDIIITDIEIPKIQGFVLLKMLRERTGTREIPVIMMTGKVEKGLLDRHARLSVRADGYLLKPFSGQDLIEMIEGILGSGDGSVPARVREQSADAVTHDPAVPAGEDPDPAGHAAALSGQEKVTVLVVDDSRYICDVTRDFLEELGVEVLTASDGESGYELASETLPDLILLDVQMPNLNGFVVCEMLRKQEKTSRIPVVLMSAVVDDESFQRHSKLRYRADFYLQKPFMKTELHDLVRRYTSLGAQEHSDVESKTGFFVPTEEDGAAGSQAGAAQADKKLAEELRVTRSELDSLTASRSGLSQELEAVRRERDRLEDEVFNLRKSTEGKEDALLDKLTLATQRVEEVRTENERLGEENRQLQERLRSLQEARDEAAGASEEELSAVRGELERSRQELEAARKETEELGARLPETGEIEKLRREMAQLASRFEEASLKALELENRKGVLEQENEELRERVEAAAAASEDRAETLEDELAAVRRDLEAARAAKKEIEEQAKSILEKRGEIEDVETVKAELEEERKENRELTTRVSEAEAQVKWLDEVKKQLDQAQSETEELRRRLDALPEEDESEVQALREERDEAVRKAETLEKDMERLIASLEESEARASKAEELEGLLREARDSGGESRKLAEEEAGKRAELEEKFRELSSAKEALSGELQEARNALEAAGEKREDVAELEKSLERERELRAAAEEESVGLRARLAALEELADAADRVESEKEALAEQLAAARERLGQLEMEMVEARQAAGADGEGPDQVETRLNERLDQLEDVLGKTVREAQSIITEQKEKESTLENSLRSLETSLEEERAAYAREREAWAARERDLSVRERELKEAFEEALRESRRRGGAEPERVFPVRIPKEARAFEVVSSSRKYGIAAAAAAVAIILFGGGFLAQSVLSGKPPESPASRPAYDPPQASVSSTGGPPQLFLPRVNTASSYEDLWRRNTVQSVSEDMMVQATLHTKEELESAIEYTAAKEGWDVERTREALERLAGTYDLSRAYYVTVYSKNLKGGYPGYADNFERHISLRDDSGKEARARLPGELEGSKFITSRVSAAGKEMNPVFIYEVGLTVSFPKQDLSSRPAGLQLVLYDIGAVPIRVLTWDVAALGSLS